MPRGNIGAGRSRAAATRVVLASGGRCDRRVCCALSGRDGDGVRSRWHIRDAQLRCAGPSQRAAGSVDGIVAYRPRWPWWMLAQRVVAWASALPVRGRCFPRHPGRESRSRNRPRAHEVRSSSSLYPCGTRHDLAVQGKKSPCSRRTRSSPAIRPTSSGWSPDGPVRRASVSSGLSMRANGDVFWVGLYCGPVQAPIPPDPCVADHATPFQVRGMEVTLSEDKPPTVQRARRDAPVRRATDRRSHLVLHRIRSAFGIGQGGCPARRHSRQEPRPNASVLLLRLHGVPDIRRCDARGRHARRRPTARMTWRCVCGTPRGTSGWCVATTRSRSRTSRRRTRRTSSGTRSSRTSRARHGRRSPCRTAGAYRVRGRLTPGLAAGRRGHACRGSRAA